MPKKIFKTGHSLVISLSKADLAKAGLKPGDFVEVFADDKKLIICKSNKGSQLVMPLKSRVKM